MTRSISKEWLRSASQDLGVIERILGDDSLTAMVMFHAQQAIEKCFKAICEEYEIDAPKVHDLVRLHAIIADRCKMDVDLAMLELIDSAYIEARYPGELGLLPDGLPSPTDAQAACAFAKSILTKATAALGP